MKREVLALPRVVVNLMFVCSKILCILKFWKIVFVGSVHVLCHLAIQVSLVKNAKITVLSIYKVIW